MVAILTHLKNKGVDSISFEQLDRYLQHADAPQFNYDTFAAAHRVDPRIKNVIQSFNKQEIVFKNDSMDALGSPEQGGDDVAAMAKRATDVGATL